MIVKNEYRDRLLILGNIAVICFVLGFVFALSIDLFLGMVSISFGAYFFGAFYAIIWNEKRVEN